MTREEQLDWLCRLRSEVKIYMPIEWVDHFEDALTESINTLLQEPKSGKWIRWREEVQRGTHYTENVPHCKCSECDTEYDTYASRFINYCPNCGAKMEKAE